MERVSRVDFGSRIRPGMKTAQGAARIPAAVTRTGIFEYQRADGSIRREYRPPEEVFKTDALQSLETAVLTDGHPGNVTPENWRTLSVGELRGARRDGKFVAADLVVRDPAILSRIDKGELQELSCGYTCRFDPSPGVTPDGERFDGTQHDLVYNHVALGPRGWGRAGSEVRMRLDGVGVGVYRDDESEMARPPRNMSNDDIQVRLDGAVADLKTVRAERDTLRTERDDAKAKIVELEKRLATVENERADARGKLKTAEEKVSGESERLDAAAEERVAILEGAALITGKRVDGKGKKPRDIMIAAVTATEPEFKADGRSDDYVRSRFDGAVERAIKAGKSLADVNRASGAAPERTDAGDVSEDFTFEEVRADFDDRRLKQWMTPDPRLTGDQEH